MKTKSKPIRKRGVLTMDGLKKTFGKAAQAVSEKVGSNADRTEMDPQFKEMERLTDCTAKAISELLGHTREYLQPNSSMRTHLVSGSSYSKVTHGGKQRPEQYEEKLGKMMRRTGLELEGTNLGTSLLTVSDAMSQLADTKNQFDDASKAEFLDPLQQMMDKDIKEVAHHRKKLNGRRLDYDYKRGKLKSGSKGVTEDEVQMSYEKLEESIQLAGNSMHTLLSNDVEQVNQLYQFIAAMKRYHEESASTLEPILNQLEQQKGSIDRAPYKEMADMSIKRDPMVMAMGGGAAAATVTRTSASAWDSTPNTQNRPVPATRNPSAQPRRPSAQALYDFEPENPGELEFQEGDVINLTSQIDENWFEGEIHGKTGFFPINYVKVLVPLN